MAKMGRKPNTNGKKCPVCGGTKTKKKGCSDSTNVVLQKYQCNDCGRLFSEQHSHTKKKRVLVISDTHCGHVTGLTPTHYLNLNPELNPYLDFQKESWMWFENMIERLKPIDVLICNGDMIDGRQERSGGSELITGDRIKQCKMASDVIKRVGANSVFMAFGCLTAGHRVLTKDLEYIPVENLKRGDKLLAFDEDIKEGYNKRHWCESEVLANKTSKSDVYKIYLSDNTTIEATLDHPFLVNENGYNEYRWQTVEMLMKRLEWCKRNNKRLSFNRNVPIWDEINTYKSGYLAAFFDGEGSFSQRRKPRRGRNEETSFAITGSQNPTIVLDTVLEYLEELKIPYTLYDKQKERDIKDVRLLGGICNILKFMGSIRPKRFIKKLDISIMGCLQRQSYKYKGEDVYIDKIEYSGKKTIYGLSTSTKTYISEGYLSHNTPYHTGKLEKFEEDIGGTDNGVGADQIANRLRLNINGCLFDVRHKIGNSTVPYGRVTQLMKQATWLDLISAKHGYPLVNIIIRSHVHYYNAVHTGNRLMFTTPSLQGDTEYGERECSGEIDYGMVVIDVANDSTFTFQEYKAELETLKKVYTEV